MPELLIVAHGQPSDPDPAEAALARFAARVQNETSDLTIRSATLAAPGRLEAAVAALPEKAAIYPLFMAKGWFVTSALPARLNGRAIPVLDPLGVDPDLPDLTADHLRTVIADRNQSPAETPIVLAAHGSGRSRNPARVANDFALALSGKLGAPALRVGFVEEQPSIEEAAQGLDTTAICLPFFALLGGHTIDDVPRALDAAGFTGLRMPVLGELPPVPALIARRGEACFHTAT
ncbi:sirohydrochlorin chelatase [Lutimaribacter marinistellae]|uniref:Sirohydrochlorin chelatase n=1 Tax=Lutimaribacter marinistellae TaxID=1820329 RepID=A0ABV7TI26_9RHOB